VSLSVRNLSVLHLIGSFNQGGSEQQALQLARLQHESCRVDVRLACLDRSGPLAIEAERLCDDEVPEYALISFYNYRTVLQLLRFADFLRRLKIDILHTHDFYTNVFGMAAGVLARVPIRIASRRETFGFRSLMQKRIERGVFRFAHAVIANSEAVRQQLAAEGLSQDKVLTIYNGLDLKRVTPPKGLLRHEALALFGLPQDADCRFITLVANMRHPVKDHTMFLRAGQRVIEAVPKGCLVIAGEGELTPQVRAVAAQLGLGRQTFFVGRCQKIAELLSISDVCVLSSKAEGFSNSILEYMAAGRPVVATDVGGAREAIVEGETGYLVPAGDYQRMAERITSLVVNPMLAQAMGQRGRSLVQEKFSAKRQLERTLALYERLIGTRDSHLRKTRPNQPSGMFWCE